MMAELTDGELVSLERVAMLRGECGRLRRAIVEARNLLLRNEHAMPPTGVERDALTILSRALEIKAP